MKTTTLQTELEEVVVNLQTVMRGVYAPDAKVGGEYRELLVKTVIDVNRLLRTVRMEGR